VPKLKLPAPEAGTTGAGREHGVSFNRWRVSLRAAFAMHRIFRRRQLPLMRHFARIITQCPNFGDCRWPFVNARQPAG
jgi:hypothetical protein